MYMRKQAKTAQKVIYNEAERGRFNERTNQVDERNFWSTSYDLLREEAKVKGKEIQEVEPNALITGSNPGNNPRSGKTFNCKCCENLVTTNATAES